tara:strand:+ start:418 stop:675 length:258 start_codon:yes stop_codon:yes gene_type:complete
MYPVNPKTYNLSSRIKLLKDSAGSLFIVIDRKSRIIMKDGSRVVKTAEQIKEVNKNKKISLLTSAPVCSKTKALLLKNDISILSL